MDRGAHPCWPWPRVCKGGVKISITIIAVNVHHYKYSILKREIKRRLNTNQKQFNIDKEPILSYKATC